MVVVLAIMGGWTFWQKIRMDRLSVAAHPDRVQGYVLGICFEWVLFAVVLAGVRRRTGSFRLVLGDHWHWATAFARHWHCPGVLDRCVGSALDLRMGAANPWEQPGDHSHAASWSARIGVVDRALCYRRDLRRGDLSGIFATAVHGTDADCPRRQHPAFGRSLWRGSPLSGLQDGDSDCVLRSDVRGPGKLARKRSAGNDCAWLAGFVERGACRCDEALGHADPT